MRFGAHRGRRGAGHTVAAARLQLVNICFCVIVHEDYSAVHQLIRQKPYQGVMIGLQKVAKTGSVQVHGIGNLQSDYLSLHFESIDGVDVANATSYAEQDYALVHFTHSTGKYVGRFVLFTASYCPFNTVTLFWGIKKGNRPQRVLPEKILQRQLGPLHGKMAVNVPGYVVWGM